MLIAAVALQVAAAVASPPPARPYDRVVVVSFDGMRPDGMERAEAPNLHRLRAEGAYLTGGRDDALSGGSAPASGSINSSQGGALQAAGQGSVQIQGNTRLNASARNLNAASLGKDNAAGNEVGSIGKK